ncbi:MAG TPA: hypothetical protein VMV48_03375 [Gallionellaceae bacterium]|nr:hypothetical protein [Gallionellaceae bacterium]
MLVKLRREYAQLVTSGAQLLLLLVGFHLKTDNGWLTCLSLMAALSLMAWLSALKRLRTVRDTPTSKIASAAQGYVELAGQGQAFGETPLLSKLSLLPCLWYRYKIEKRSSDNKWETIDSGESNDSFMLRDDTGLCIVDPEQAEIITRHREQWLKDDHRYTEWNLIANDKLYAIGHFRTQGGSTADFNTREELNALLADWKKDMPELHGRFDLDNNGTLDMQEWMLARSAAKREIGKRMREAQAAPDFHIISQPRDGKLFLISNLEQHDLSRRYLFWTWAHLLIFIVALSALAWLLQTPAADLGLHR